MEGYSIGFNSLRVHHITAGALDEAFRHSISKMATLHLTATDEYRRRVIQLGESPDRVHCVGALGLDSVIQAGSLSRAEVEQRLHWELADQTFLITFHPATVRDEVSIADEFRQLLSALKAFPYAHLIFTRPNADSGCRVLNTLLDQFISENIGRARAYASLGSELYLELLGHVQLVLGNSSSGILEVPSFRIPTVNIGDRQKGRTRAASVVDCQPEARQIVKAIEYALSPAFARIVVTSQNPYGDGQTAGRVVSLLKSTRPDPQKVFHDLDFGGISE